MAAAKRRSGSSGIFWMNGVSDEEQPLVFVPGADGEARTVTPFGTRMRGAAGRSSACGDEATLKRSGKKQGRLQSGRSGAYTKDQVSAAELPPSPAPGAFPPPAQVMCETSSARSQACLKDLRPEDKRRIANLIEELARVSEEKEESVQRLKDEQEHFEHKIQQLEQQNLIIAQERGSLQQQYRECQELLGLYQQYLSQQQAKLNESIAQLRQAPAHSKVLSGEEAHSRSSTSRANAALFDGSYLSLAATRANQPQAHRAGEGGRAAAHTGSHPASVSCVSEFCPTDGPITQHRVHKGECREPHSEHCHRCEPCPGSGQDSGYGTQQRGERNGRHDASNQRECERLQSAAAVGSDAKEALTRPLLGHEDWEEKRHQLLLQKMQLEMERERLQARLSEQEERLSRQNQQLRQSRLDYSRLQQAAQAELSSSNSRNGDPQPEGPPHQDLPPRARGGAEVLPAEHNRHEKSSQPAPLHEAVSSEQSRRDMATSPAQSAASPSEPASVSVSHKPPEARLDFSVVELLDIFSPASAPEQSKPSTRRSRTSQRRPALATPRPAGPALLTPAGRHPQSSQQDLEESRILEDVFFIC